MRFNAMLGSLLALSAATSARGGILSGTDAKQLQLLKSRLPHHAEPPRSKTKPDRPSKKGNRATLSARTRRRHRRAA